MLNPTFYIKTPLSMTLTCAIIDDEPLAVKLLQSYVAKTPFLELRGSYASAVEALYTLQTEPVDLLFLDIQMPELGGLDMAKMLHGETRIVFTTAFDQYAIDSYKVNAADYLLKPVSYTDFLSAAQRVQAYFERIRSAADAPAETADSFFVKSEHKFVRVRYADILYVEGLKDYVKIYLEGEKKSVVSLTSMRTLESFLPTEHFLRIHRSYIVNMAQVSHLERAAIVFGERKLPISDSYKDRVQEYVSRYLLQGRSGQ